MPYMHYCIAKIPPSPSTNGRAGQLHLGGGREISALLALTVCTCSLVYVAFSIMLGTNGVRLCVVSHVSTSSPVQYCVRFDVLLSTSILVRASIVYHRIPTRGYGIRVLLSGVRSTGWGSAL